MVASSNACCAEITFGSPEKTLCNFATVSIRSQTKKYAFFHHLRNRGNARRELHVGLRIMNNANSPLLKDLYITPLWPNHMRSDHSFTQEANPLEVSNRTCAFRFDTVVNFAFCL